MPSLRKYWDYLTVLVLVFVPLYPKFPLFGVGGSFVAVRLEDFVVAAVVGLWVVLNFSRKFDLIKHPVFLAIVLYFLSGLVATFSGGFLTKTIDIKQGLLHLLRRVEYMSMFAVGFGFFKQKVEIGFIVKAILLISLLVSLYGLGQQFLNFPVISTNNSEFAKGLALTLGPGARLNSTFAGHYDLAAFSILPILLIIGLLAIDSRHKWFLLVIGALAYWVMLLSASRVTFAAIILSVAIFMIVLRRFKWLAMLILVAVASVLFSGQLLARYKQVIESHFSAVVPVAFAAVDEQTPDALKPSQDPNEDRSLSIRLNAEWPRAIRAFEINPVLGTGFSSVGLAVDNDFLRIIAETGLLGLASFALIIFCVAKSSWKYLWKKPQTIEEIFILSVNFFLFGILLNAVFIDVFEASKIAILIWLLLGAAENVKQNI